MSSNKRKPEILEIIDIIKKSFNMRYNVVKETSEYSEKGEGIFKEVTEIFINSLVINLKCAGLRCSYSLVDQIFNSDMLKQYNPFEQYFKSLPKWDDTKDSEIEKLSNTVKTTNQDFFKLCLERWLLGLVSCALNEKDINHQMIVYSGKQGLGKSTWIRSLVPDQLIDYYYSGSINTSNKDTSIFLSQCFLINLDELTNLNKKETGSLKEIITKESINVRRAYAKKTKRLSRRASFIGSINDSEFLYDRIKFTTYKTERKDYKMRDQFTRNQLLHTLQEDINILIQQYLRFGRRVVEEFDEDDNEIISFPKDEMPKGYIDSLHNTIKKNWNNNAIQ